MELLRLFFGANTKEMRSMDFSLRRLACLFVLHLARISTEVISLKKSSSARVKIV